MGLMYFFFANITTKPLILALIIFQTILFNIDSALTVYNDSRNKPWNSSIRFYLLVIVLVINTWAFLVFGYVYLHL
jgi:hypothetical protein